MRFCCMHACTAHDTKPATFARDACPCCCFLIPTLGASGGTDGRTGLLCGRGCRTFGHPRSLLCRPGFQPLHLAQPEHQRAGVGRAAACYGLLRPLRSARTSCARLSSIQLACTRCACHDHILHAQVITRHGFAIVATSAEVILFVYAGVNLTAVTHARHGGALHGRGSCMHAYMHAHYFTPGHVLLTCSRYLSSDLGIHG